jgi:hypothetical protein
MASMEDDITNHLHLCVALMSDPLIMREQPWVVANHFTSAMGKIEQLQVLLAVPAEPCARQNWLGSSVLNGGIRRMVGLVLVRHMEPLRWKHPKILAKQHAVDGLVENQKNAAPPIFATHLDRDDGRPQLQETDLAREIKENNCMAALVLLYYYLYWHLLLILLNFRMHPCVGGHEVEGRLDVDRLLKGLPAFFDTFEFRPLRGAFKRDYTLRDGGQDISDGSSDGDNSEEDSDDEEDKNKHLHKSGGSKSDANRQALDELNSITDHIGRACASGTRGEALGQYMISMAGKKGTKPDAHAIKSEGNDLLKDRKSGVMKVYRMVLASTSAVKKADKLLYNAHAAMHAALELSVCPDFTHLATNGKIKEAHLKHLEQRIVQYRDLALIEGLDLDSHSLSVFDLQDSVQRWFDMSKPFEVKSLTSDQDADDIDCRQKRYTCILSEVLYAPPYSVLSSPDLLKKTARTCIHDFNSTSLMMDVCGSFLKMHKVVSDLRAGVQDDGIVKKGLMVFIMQTYASDRSMQKLMKHYGKEVIRPETSMHESCGLVSTPIGNFRKPARVEDARVLTSELNMYELAGRYWGSKQADLNSVNHTYFAWPYIERGNYHTALKVVQRLLLGSRIGSHAVSIKLFASSGQRNSLFVSSVVKSLLAMIDGLHCTALLDGSAIAIRETATIYRTKSNTVLTAPLRSKEWLEQEVLAMSHFGVVGPHVKYNVSKQTLIDDLKAELSALSVRMERVRRGEFKLYTGHSWPVSYANTHNHNAFQLSGEMQLAPRTRQEYYLSKMAKTAGSVNRFVDENAEFISMFTSEAQLAFVQTRADRIAEAAKAAAALKPPAGAAGGPGPPAADGSGPAVAAV